MRGIEHLVRNFIKDIFQDKNIGKNNRNAEMRLSQALGNSLRIAINPLIAKSTVNHKKREIKPTAKNCQIGINFGLSCIATFGLS